VYEPRRTGRYFRFRYLMLLPLCAGAASSPYLGAIDATHIGSGATHREPWLQPPQSREYGRAQGATAPILKLPLVADGAQSPELIPDRLAYRHFIAATAVNAQMDQKDIARRDVFLRSAGLDKSAREAYSRAVQPIADELLRLTRSNGTAPLVTLRRLPTASRNLLLDQGYANVRAALTPEAMSRLDAHIQEHVKKRITVYGHAPAR
jgi:hypothetical protein